MSIPVTKPAGWTVTGFAVAVLFALPVSVSAQEFNEPYDAVLAMAARQNCIATESEIYDAIVNAGFGDWDANLFVTGGARNGTLKLISKKNSTYRYQISRCKQK